LKARFAAGPLKLVKTYGGVVYPSSNVIMRAAFFPTIAASRAGTQLASHASPCATEQECMLLQSFGVSQMKFVPALNAERTSFDDPGSKFAHRDELPVTVVYDRNGKWSSPRGGFRPQPVPDASSAKAFQLLPAFSRRSTIVGWFRLRWIRDAAPTRGERELVRECGEEGRGAVHLVQVLVLHEDDDELVEVVRRLREHGSWTHRAIGNAQKNDSRADEGAEEDEHGHQPGAYNVNP